MITLATKTNAARRETTVTATDSVHGVLCSETWSGTGSRVAVALAEHVRVSAEQQLRRHLLASATSTQETRQLATRLA